MQRCPVLILSFRDERISQLPVYNILFGNINILLGIIADFKAFHNINFNEEGEVFVKVFANGC